MVDTGHGRREFLVTSGGAVIVGLAGCSGGGGNNGGGSESTTTSSSSGGGGTTEEQNGGGGSEDTYTFGHLNPFSGGLGWVGENARKGRDIAFSEINDAGLLGGEVEANEQDTQTSPQPALNGFQTLESAGVPAIIGPSSTVMPNLVEPIQNAKVPLCSISAGTIQLDDVPAPYVWRTVPSDGIAGRAQSRWAYNNDYKKLALAYKNDKGSQSFSASVGKFFKALGGEVVTEVALDPNADSYRSEVNTLKSSDAEVVSMTAGTEVSSLFIKNYTELGADFQMMLGNDVLTQSFIDKMGADVMKGMVGQGPAPGPAGDAFREKHESEYGEAPGTFSGATYDAVNLFALAAEKAGEVSRSAIANNLMSVGRPPGTEVTTFPEGKKALENGDEINYTGAATNCNFDENGNVIGPFNVVQVKNGEWTTIKTYSADSLSQ